MIGEQVAKTVLAQALAHEPLEDVHVRVAVALDEHRSVLENCDVPPDDDAIVELAMRCDRQLFDLAPDRQAPPFDLGSSVWMRRKPPEPCVRTEVCCLRQLAAAELDIRRDPAGVKIVHGMVRAYRHPENASDHLRLADFVEACDHPNSRKRAVRDFHKVRMWCQSGLHDDRAATGIAHQPRKQIVRGHFFPVRTTENTASDPVPALSTAAAPARRRLHEQVVVRKRRVTMDAVQFQGRFDACKPALSTILSEAHFVVEWRAAPPLQERENRRLRLEALQVSRRATASILFV
jgi:hypothetical protein